MHGTLFRPVSEPASAADDIAERPDHLRPQAAPRPDRAGRALRFRVGLGGALTRLAKGIVSWHRRARNRRLLASYDDRMLRDIGIDRATVERESTASFWRCR